MSSFAMEIRSRWSYKSNVKIGTPTRARLLLDKQDFWAAITSRLSRRAFGCEAEAFPFFLRSFGLTTYYLSLVYHDYHSNVHGLVR